MLEVADDKGFKFDTVQMPLNVMDAHYRSFAKLVVPELTKRNIGILGMKSMANGILLRSNTVTPIECLHYALNLPTSVVITGMDSMEILDQAFEAVQTFQPMTDEQVQALLNKTAEAGSRGEFEPFKTSSIFDDTAQHPDWLGEEPQRLQQLMSAAG
jgi:aryl-alcohol dehydrogenase-like predicted oxidoreductase